MSALADAPDLLTVEEVAVIYRISRTSAYDAVRAGEIPSVKIGRRVRIPKAALLKALGVEPAVVTADSPATGVDAGWNGAHLCTSGTADGAGDPVAAEASQ